MLTPVGIAFVLLVPWAAALVYASLAQKKRRRFILRLNRAATAHLPIEPVAPTGVLEDRRASFPWTCQLLERLGFYRPIERALRKVDAPISVGECAACVLTLWICAPLLAWGLGRPWFVVLAVLIVALLTPRLALKVLSGWRKKQFALQLAEALQLITSSLRVGHGIQRALLLVAEEGAPPLSSEFRRALAEIQVGVTVDVALQRISDRVESKEMDLVANVVAIQMQIGGNLAEIIERVGETIREREEMQNEVKALTAEGRMTAVVCIAMPPLMGLFQVWANPRYMDPLLKTSLGIGMLVGMGVLQLMGAIVIRKMMKIED
jgi:tight adherence protein B